MKIVRLGINGIETVAAHAVVAKNGQRYFAIDHGQTGRGRWNVRFPLAAREFPVPVEDRDRIILEGDEYKLIDLKRKDPRGNQQFLLALGKSTNDYLVFWHMSPGFRGGANYKISGSATLLAEGQEAQGDAGRMGGAPCPVVHVIGPCRLTWERFGRLYGSKSRWTAEFDGETWTVAPSNECVVEEAVLNY